MGGEHGVVDYKNTVHVSSVKGYVVRIYEVFIRVFSSCCRNISAMVPEISEPMATPLSGWYIGPWKEY